MREELHRQLRVDRVGDREPDALTQGAQGLWLLGEEQDVATIRGRLELLAVDEDGEGLAAEWPGIGAPLRPTSVRAICSLRSASLVGSAPIRWSVPYCSSSASR
jgi:hypothetical protein